MERANKILLVLGSLGAGWLLCNLSAFALSRQMDSLAVSAADIAQAQAMHAQAQAMQQTARAMQSLAHTMNLLLLVVLMIVMMLVGVYLWKTKQTSPPSPPAPLPTPSQPLRVVYLPPPQLPEGEEATPLDLEAILDAWMSEEEWH